MTLRRLLLLAGVLLILFLGMYSWNQRTRFLDDMAAKLGLEITGAVLTPIRSAQDAAENMWARYFDLVAVREENEALKIFRLALSQNVGKVVKLAMGLLGIEVPERM